MFNGILPIYKEKGMTSHDVVFKVRKILKMKKIGHSGTLDPQVDGVLLLLIGDATKVSDYAMDLGKSYKAEVCLGVATTTEDLEGDIIEEKIVEDINIILLKKSILSLIGEIEQIPPIYSAVKVNGKKLYEYARKGIFDVERPKRIVNIYDIKLEENSIYYQDGRCYFSIEVSCGKGTYIRTLATQIAEKMSLPGTMSKLSRIRSGKICLKDCITLTELLNSDVKDIENKILPKEYALEEYKFVEIPLFRVKQALNGLRFRKNQFPEYDFTDGVVFTYKGKAVAIYYLKNKNDELLSVKTTFSMIIE